MALRSRPHAPAGNTYEVMGETFTNSTQATRWWELKMLERAGMISDLRRKGKVFTFHDIQKNKDVEERIGNASKYGNKRVEVDGLTFDSKREAARFQQLKVLEKTGRIKDLQRQVPFPVHLQNGAVLFTYFADFVYTEDGRTVVEDSKGARTDVFKIKAKAIRLEYGITILET